LPEARVCPVKVEEKDGLFYIHIHKGKTENVNTKQTGSVVLITTDRLGTGDNELGQY